MLRPAPRPVERSPGQRVAGPASRARHVVMGAPPGVRLGRRHLYGPDAGVDLLRAAPGSARHGPPGGPVPHRASLTAPGRGSPPANLSGIAVGHARRVVGRLEARNGRMTRSARAHGRPRPWRNRDPHPSCMPGADSWQELRSESRTAGGSPGCRRNPARRRRSAACAGVDLALPPHHERADRLGGRRIDRRWLELGEELLPDPVRPLRGGR